MDKNDMEALVEYTAPYAADLSDMTPVFVAVNGEGCLIKRGEPVRIKRKFARVLEQSDLQDRLAQGLMEAGERDFERMRREM